MQSFEIVREEFLKYLEILSVGIEKKKNELLALRGIRIKVEDGLLSMASTNLQISVKIFEVPLTKSDGDLDLVIASDRLFSIVKASTVSTLKFKYKKPILTLHANGMSRLNTYNLKEFPNIHVVSPDDEPVAVFPKSRFSADMERASKVVARKEDSRSHLSGVCIDGDLYATDGQKMIHITRGEEINPVTVVPEVVDALLKMSSPDEEELSLYLIESSGGGEANAVFEMGNIRVGSMTFSTAFPRDEVANIIKTSKEACSIKALISRTKLLEALGRASLFEDSQATADFRFVKKSQTLEVRCIMLDKSGEEYREKIPCKFEGPDKVFTITLNFRELQSILSSIMDSTILFRFSDREKPFYFRIKDKSLEFICLPLRRV